MLGESCTPMRRGENRKERGSVGRGGIEGKTVSLSSPPPATEDGSAGHGRMDGRTGGGLASETATEKDDDGGEPRLPPSKRLLERRSAVRRENPRVVVVVLFPTSELRGMEALPKIRSQSVSFPWPEGEEEDLLGISSKSSFEDAPATFAQDVILRRGREGGQG